MYNPLYTRGFWEKVMTTRGSQRNAECTPRVLPPLFVHNANKEQNSREKFVSCRHPVATQFWEVAEREIRGFNACWLGGQNYVEGHSNDHEVSL